MAEVFENQDQGYLKWKAKNQDGMVINVYYSDQRHALHKANCSAINKEYNPPRSLTGGNVFKVCSNDIEDLAKWIKYNKVGKSIREIKGCKRCNCDGVERLRKELK